MSLQAGQKLAHYEILEPIGKGGMGEVYRARDTKLDRDVAVKVLPEEFARNDERLARFEREAKLLASLNHPNIASIHGFEESDGVHALVLELVEGPTLAERIQEGPIPVDETLVIARQIAEALEAGHEAGVIHRDVKPANVKLKEDGTVKVLDYGLAKALEGDAAGGTDAGQSQSPTLTRQGTQVGVILGTAAYMSPEQAKGKRVDKRTDVWAFGAVVYEMLTGQRAFGGEDVSDTLAAVLRSEPDLDALPAATPESLRLVLRLCLTKDVKERLQSIGDVRLAMTGAFASSSVSLSPEASRRPPAALIAAGFVLGAILAGIVVWSLRPVPPPRGTRRFEIEMQASQQLRNAERSVVAVSPIGDAFAYNTTSGIYLRRLDELEARRIPGTDSRFTAGPFFSPDGEWIGYFEGRELKRVAVSGGAPAVIVRTSGFSYFGASWAADDSILYGQPEGIFRVAVSGGEPQLVVPAQEGEQLYGPELLPDGDSLLFSVTATGNWDEAQVVLHSLATGERTVLREGGSGARYVPTNHLLYAQGEALFAVAFDVERRSTIGAPVEILPKISRSLERITGAAHYGVSDQGTLVYVPAFRAASQLTWFDRRGNRIELVGEPTVQQNFTLSPDERRVAVERGVGESTSIWITDMDRNVSSMLVPSSFRPSDYVVDPIWSPDGQRVAFSSPRDRLVFAVPAGGGEPVLLLELPSDRAAVSEDWSPDGQFMALLLIDSTLPVQGAVLPLQGEQTPVIFDEAENLDGPHFSPDGQWIAYNADRTGSGMEVYVVPFPPTGERLQVSVAGGSQARWRADGRELFYLSPEGTVMAVAMDTTRGLVPSTPVPLFETGLLVDTGLDQYAVTGDGQRFLVALPADDDNDASRGGFIVVLDWFDELKRLVPSN